VSEDLLLTMQELQQTHIAHRELILKELTGLS
jgi:hypothetical protein